MYKIILSILFAATLVSASGVKANGCDLSVVGDVMMSVDSDTNISQKATYNAVSPSGKNFRSILVGSTMSLDGITLKILDIKANKRVKREARTGSLSVLVSKDSKTQNIDMQYSYDKGIFNAKAKQQNGDNISFVLEIKALLCHI